MGPFVYVLRSHHVWITRIKDKKHCSVTVAVALFGRDVLCHLQPIYVTIDVYDKNNPNKQIYK